jgi:hypothetical protein
MPPLFSYEIVRLLRRFAKGLVIKSICQSLHRPQTRSKGCERSCANVNHFCSTPVVRRSRPKTYASASAPKSKNEAREGDSPMVERQRPATEGFLLERENSI